MKELCDLRIQINGEHTFFVSQNVLNSFSGRIRKILREENRIIDNTKGTVIRFIDFPGGTEGFELVSRFCHNNGRIAISPGNICLLHCAANFLEMEEEITPCNLLKQTENFLDGVLYLNWHDLLISLKSCESFFAMADSSGLLQKLLSTLISQISAKSERTSRSFSSSSEASVFRRSSSMKSIEAMKPCSIREWWFPDLLIFAPNMIEKMVKELGAYECENGSLTLTKFLLYYLKSADQRGYGSNWDYGGLAGTAVYGVLKIGRNVFSYKVLLWILRLVSRLGLSKECREKLDRLIGSMFDKAELDDLLVSGHDD
ncbi:BTB/POZ domain-containing protein At3g19850-like, partial [Phalaenopsis equestris]|uniref:BTB/POZ domain-containing protein At3g19850-like n=1 Tax=Phalaenopsis equestris TaxID=78828 RepID=UPI0009E355F9